MGDNPVPYEDPSTQTYVAIDDVSAKKQKAHRGPDPVTRGIRRLSRIDRIGPKSGTGYLV